MDDTMDYPEAKEVITWTRDIANLFTALDATCMFGQSAGHIDLHEYESVKRSAPAILGQVEAGNMPPAHSGEPPWPAARVALFKAWIAGGCR